MTKEEKREYNRKHYAANRESEILRKRKYYSENKDKINSKSFCKKWYSANREYKIRYQTVYEKNKLKTDLNFRLTKVLRSRIRSAIKNNQRKGSAVKDLGCSIQEFKLYLESKFQTGMTWENWGQYGWHIDHIIPLSSFDLSDRDQFLKACHYTNLQPLWASENLHKKNKILN